MSETSQECGVRRQWPRPIVCAVVTLLLIAAVVTAMTVLRYRMLWQVDDAISDLGGTWRFNSGLPKWLRRHVDRRWQMLFIKRSFVDLSLRATDEDLQILHRIPGLYTVDLSFTRITDEGLKHFASLPEIRFLRLHETSITQLENLGALPQLRELSISETQVDDEAAETLLRWPTLEYLAAAGTPLTDRALDTIVRLPKLNHLTLEGHRFSRAGLAKLAGMKNLRSLTLQETAVDNDTVRLFGGLPNLEYLNLNRSDVTATAFETAGAFPELQHLYLDGCPVTDTDLATMVIPSKLTTIVLLETPITQSGVIRLQSAHPHLSIGWSPPESTAGE